MSTKTFGGSGGGGGGCSIPYIFDDNNEEGRPTMFLCQRRLMQSMQEFFCDTRSDRVAPVWAEQRARSTSTIMNCRLHCCRPKRLSESQSSHPFKHMKYAQLTEMPKMYGTRNTQLYSFFQWPHSMSIMWQWMLIC